MERTIRRGNFYDSRNGGHSYSMWTSGYDVCITEEDGKKYFYQLRNYDHNIVTNIEPVELVEAQEISWEEVSEDIRKEHFAILYPNGSEAEMNIFVFGEEKGREINSEREWAEAHLVYDITTTLQIAEEIGRFEEVELRKTFRKWNGGCECYSYLIDGKWFITVTENNIIIDEYAKIVAQKKAFGEKVHRIAKKAKVPWKIASFVGHIESEKEAVDILKRVKKARGTADECLQRELSYGIQRRTKAIETILGEDWKKFDCKGQKKTTILANYLLGEMVG